MPITLEELLGGREISQLSEEELLATVVENRKERRDILGYRAAQARTNKSKTKAAKPKLEAAKSFAATLTPEQALALLTQLKGDPNA